MPQRDDIGLASNWTRELEMSQVEFDERIVAEVLKEVPITFDHPMTTAEIAEVEPTLRAVIEYHTEGNAVLAEGIMRSLLQQMHGYGPLEPLFVGPGATSITEIQITPARGEPPRVFVVREGKEEPWPQQIFATDKEVHDWVRKTADSLDVTWNEQHPIADLWLDDGSRINAVGFRVNPFSHDATIATIRKSPALVEPIPLSRMVELETLTEEMADLLISSGIRGRRNILWAGPTDSGKTSLLRACAQEIDPRDHVAVVETSWEVYLPHLPNAVNFVEKHSAGKVIASSADIGKALLRQNFKRAIYGEIRFAEIQPAVDQMQSVAGGCLTTMHAWSPYTLNQRFVTCYGYAGRTLSLEEAKATVCGTFDLVVFSAKDKDGRRRITEIYETHEEQGYRPLFRLDVESGRHEQVGKVSPDFMTAVHFAGGEIPVGLRP